MVIPKEGGTLPPTPTLPGGCLYSVQGLFHVCHNDWGMLIASVGWHSRMLNVLQRMVQCSHVSTEPHPCEVGEKAADSHSPGQIFSMPPSLSFLICKKGTGDLPRKSCVKLGCPARHTAGAHGWPWKRQALPSEDSLPSGRQVAGRSHPPQALGSW